MVMQGGGGGGGGREMGGDVEEWSNVSLDFNKVLQ